MDRLDLDLSETDRRIAAWARWARDRPRFTLDGVPVPLGSAESHFRAVSEDLAGWGTEESEVAPRPPTMPYVATEVERTHWVIRNLEIPSKWSLTLSFCYPWLGVGRTLAIMRHRTGRRYNLRNYRELVDMARIKVHKKLFGSA